MADKGLKGDSVGLIGSTVLSISSVAPAYALTATIGILAASAGAKVPVVIIAGFLPMFFAAYAYREMNKVSPDCGTSFTWTTKAFGPVIGWLGGWTAILATIFVLSNLAAVAVQFFYQFFGEVFGSQTIADLWLNTPINVLTCLAFLGIASYVAYRGVDATEKVQIVLVSFQLIILLIFSVLAIAKHGESGVGLDFSWDWFSPSGLTLSAFIAGLSGSIFAFWGWDVSLTVNEESKDREKIPGRAALLCVVSILLTYLIVSIATQMYAGLGETGIGLANPDTADNVFGVLAEPVMGNFGILLFLAVLASSAASLITTFFPTTRTMLAMSSYKALPAGLQKIHPVQRPRRWPS
ncbi:APC family permease [Ornithinimicrobium sp. INDO-MA30-4]|uniref:APC family permease n=1 Tax=Ornithinimicrobium sp. INDO-MA30-4 TaxID=2908651 RepID=UPI00288308D5|nr:APC family permease [Ornithinimicrobium sp. INDO-MA30-4]